jgi:manganese-dependent inorganic pyrophosphatase
MAYAALRNALGDREYKAGRLGLISDETKLVLDRFGFEAPEYVKDIRPQVRDLDFDTPTCLNKGATVSRAWSLLHSENVMPALPIINDDGTLYGMTSIGDVATYNMESCEDPYLHEVSLFNLLGAIEGKVRNKAGAEVDSVHGEVVISLPQSRENLLFANKDSIVICGDQPDMVRRALDIGVNCIIVCQAELEQEFYDTPTDTCIISTPLGPVRTARMLYQAAQVSELCKNQNLVSFHLTDYIDDVRDVLRKSRYRSYPILDENERVVGTLSQYHVLHHKKKRVVLVDHNEASQSVPGLDQAEIIGIIDHHRLADIQTSNPVFVRNEPVGSTTTIIAAMYQARGLMPSENMAGLMAAAILSDTVIFKSPTCTQIDREMATRLARIANVSLEELGKEIFSASYGDNKPVAELVGTDFKQFHIAGHNVAVSQITCVDADGMSARKDEFMEYLEQLRKKDDYEFVVLMVTDILKEGSLLLCAGNSEAIHQAFNVPGDGNSFFLPGIISRKKQVIPMLSAIWG